MKTNDLDSDSKGSLADWLAGLPDEAVKEYARTMHTFVHDLRQPLAQIHSAEELLRRHLADAPNGESLQELLDIIRGANQRASNLVAGFVEEFLEGLELE